jgi:hypothetical protein
MTFVAAIVAGLHRLAALPIDVLIMDSLRDGALFRSIRRAVEAAGAT